MSDSVILNPAEQLQLPLEAPVQNDWHAEVPSVSELTRRLRGHIESTFFDVWVKGEISNFRKPVSGHGYFVLKDAKSQLRAVIFRNRLSKHKFKVHDGMEVILHGAIGVYESRGEYQIVCDTIEPVGMGALQLAFEQLKLKLQKEGLFDQKHKKPLPFLPQRIGIITSATGAAVRDVLKVLSKRFLNLESVIIPATVQGEKAAPEIVRAIQQAQQWNLQYPNRPIEVLIVGRGGGSLEDLWPFNEEIVARSIFDCPIPVISAVGHEIDFTISDFVADVRAATPSAAAEIVVPRKDELLYRVQTLQQRLSNTINKSLQQCRLHLGHLSQRLVDPREKIKKLGEDFKRLTDRLRTTLQTNLLLARKQLESSCQMLHSLSPLQVLGRGYSITQKPDGTIVRSVNSVKKGDRLRQRIADGTIESQVLSTHDKLDK